MSFIIDDANRVWRVVSQPEDNDPGDRFTGVLDSGGAITGERESDSGTITIQEDPDEDQSAGAR